MEYKKNVPAKINDLFEKHSVDAAFISSIKAKKYKYSNLGIVAKKDVMSVLVIPDDNYVADTESATSNILSKVLGIRGEVLIGDKALRYYLMNENHIDLALQWNNKYKLPFVFALLSYHKHSNKIKKIENNFLKTSVKIPQYILKKAAIKTQISEKDILKYLKKISYKVDSKAKMGLKKFYRLSSNPNKK
jgi:chorismate dehydratase